MDRSDLLDKLDELGFCSDDFGDDADEELIDRIKDCIRDHPEGTESWEEALKEFREESLLTKTQVLKELENLQKNYGEKLFSGHSDSYVKTLKGVLDEFSKKISYASFPEPLPDFWRYRISVSVRQAELCLVKTEYSFSASDDLECCIDSVTTGASYVLLAVQAPQLSVSEYAKLYGVVPVTVRQWIRRGRLRGAEKVQNEWLISALIEPPRERGYTPRGYWWMPPLQKLPKEYGYLNRFSAAYFEKAKNGYRVELDDQNVCNEKFERELERCLNNLTTELPEVQHTTFETLTLTAAEREMLEHFMTESADIHALTETIITL